MQKRKVNISMMLKVPINLEIEILGVPPINNHQDEEQKENQKVFNLIAESEPEVIIDEASLPELDENILAIIDQLVEQLQPTSKTFSKSPIQYQQDNLGNDEEKIVETRDSSNTFSIEEFAVIQPQTPPENQNIRVRLLDSFNDAFALAVNSIATVLFLGKLVNYSWD